MLVRVLDLGAERPRALTAYEGTDADSLSWEVLYLSDAAADGEGEHRGLARLFVTQAGEARALCLAAVERGLGGEGAQAAAAAADAAAAEEGSGSGQGELCFLRGCGGAGGEGRPGEGEGADPARLVAGGAAEFWPWCSMELDTQEELCQVARNAFRVRSGSLAPRGRTQGRALLAARCRLSRFLSPPPLAEPPQEHRGWRFAFREVEAMREAFALAKKAEAEMARAPPAPGALSAAFPPLPGARLGGEQVTQPLTPAHPPLPRHATRQEELRRKMQDVPEDTLAKLHQDVRGDLLPPDTDPLFSSPLTSRSFPPHPTQPCAALPLPEVPGRDDHGARRPPLRPLRLPPAPLGRRARGQPLPLPRAARGALGGGGAGGARGARAGPAAPCVCVGLPPGGAASATAADAAADA